MAHNKIYIDNAELLKLTEMEKNFYAETREKKQEHEEILQ